MAALLPDSFLMLLSVSPSVSKMSSTTSGTISLQTAEEDIETSWSAVMYSRSISSAALAVASDEEFAVPVACSSSRAYKRRWAAFLSVAGMRAFADTLLYGTAWNTELHDGEGPPVGQLLEQDKYEDAPEGSRLPVRA